MKFINKFNFKLIILAGFINLLTELSLAAPPGVERAPIKLIEFSYFDKEILNAVKNALKDPRHTIDDDLKSFLSRFTDGYGRAFNPSIARLRDDYLVCARVAVSSINEEIIPGSSQIAPMLEHNRKAQNFLWSTETRIAFRQRTLFFKCNSDLKNCIFLTPINPIKREVLDTRLLNQNGLIFIYSPEDSRFMRQVLKVKVTGSSGIIEISKKPILNLDGIGKNFGVFDLNDQTYSYLDWFDKIGMYYRIVDRSSGKTQEVKHLKYKDSQYPILGSGSIEEDGNNAGRNSGIMPMFSFSTPHVIVGDTTIGVGHIKINTDPLESYKAGSRIDAFKRNLEDEFEKTYGKNYIRFEANFMKNDPPSFNAFLYLLYFYTFKRDAQGNITDFTISNAFLPVPPPKEGGPYRFSLIFPTGLTFAPDDKTLIITAGYGDFHAVVMKIKVEDVLNLSVHDIQNLDLSKYSYQILETEEPPSKAIKTTPGAGGSE